MCAPDRSGRHSRSVLQSVCAVGGVERGSGLFWASGKKSPGAGLSVEGQMSFCIKGNFVRTLPPLDPLYFLLAIGLAAPPAVAGAPKGHWSLCLSCRGSPLSGCRFHSACAAVLLSGCRIAAERVASGRALACALSHLRTACRLTSGKTDEIVRARTASSPCRTRSRASCRTVP